MDVVTDEHRMLQDSLDGIVFEGADPAGIWPQLAELGMLGLTLSEGDGGAGLGLDELILFARSFGQACLTTPFLGSEIMAMPLLAELTSHSKVSALLPDLTAGKRIATVALDDLAPVMAARVSGGFKLGGTKMLVPAGAQADIIVLAVLLDGAPALFLLDAGSEGISREAYLPEGPNAGADITLKDVMLTEDALLAEGPLAAKLISDAYARAQLATCADMAGGMDKLLELTADYLRTRQQFGQSLASFQVLKHAAVDMYVELETANAMLDYGTRMFDASGGERARALDAVKFKLNSAAKTVGEIAVQLHGGIGMTQESLTGRLFARLTAERLAFGDSRTCLGRLVLEDASIALS